MNFVETAPALIGVAVALLVWYRHRADRRARVFLALAASELAFGLPVFLSLNVMPGTAVGIAALDGLVVTIGLLSAALFLHFGLTFPHARPWLSRGRMSSVYVAAAIVGLVPIVAAIAGTRAQASIQDVFDGVLMLVGPLVLLAGIAACVAIVRSFREMPPDDRRTYRVPVIGVLVGMVAGLLVDVLFAIMAAVFAARGFHTWTPDVLDLLATAAGLTLPLFFFMAAYRYRLLERHSQDYVSQSETAPRR